ncbi:MAG: SoxXA-binding protein [Sedimenticola sp.]|nr:SoxXA-binding protein [Sedimenticola sp.]MCW8946230.1 SoxXA-binding protein [Sedimenticola sp.]MCW8975933.1 SoxXA-binding protein [Sedimenticola sp.]
MNKRNMIGLLILSLLMAVQVAVAADSKGDMAKMDNPMAVKAADAITKAEAARKKAASVDGEWRDTGKFIKKAEEAAKAGDYEKALKLAKKAEDEGELGYEQQVSQRELKMPSYLKY